ncbi:hypothetical protein ACFQ4K_14535 [Tistrella bauzanensis]
MDEVLVTTLQTAVSRGTETLIATGGVPETEYQRMRAPFQEGDFPFPVKYGYAAVGQTPDGGRVFALHPHQDRFVLPRAALRPVPDIVPTARAVLAANMETALNVLWDAGAGPGDRITVIGAGLVGLLAARLARRLPGRWCRSSTATRAEAIRRGHWIWISARPTRRHPTATS